MQIHASDPAFTDSQRARANFRLAVKLTLGFVALIWFIQLLNWALDLGVEDFGVRPRELAGLPGILFAPLMHSGFPHLIANSLPVLIVGTAMLYLYPSAVLRVLPAVYLGPGVAVWLFARGGVHVGAAHFEFAAHDVFVVPSWETYRFSAATECVIFSYSDRAE